MKQMLHTKALVVKENISEQNGVIDAVVGSTNVLDRMGDIIDQNGWDLKDYKSNPVILWGHNVREEKPPIGKAVKVWIENKGKSSARLMFKVQFDLLDQFAAEIFRKIKDGFLNTVSVGFLPIEWEELDPDNWFGGIKYSKQQLLELSFVPVPANPQALVGLRSFAEKDKRFAPEEEKTLYPQPSKEELAKMLHKDLSEPIEKDQVIKPLENEHACRLRNPDDFQDDSFRSMNRNHEGKDYRVIMGKLEGKDTMTDQSFRYTKET
jgi:HK97 family phage prohead protease